VNVRKYSASLGSGAVAGDAWGGSAPLPKVLISRNPGQNLNKFE